jgi:hypothetical protein
MGSRVPILIGGLARNDVVHWSDARRTVDRAHRQVARDLPASGFVDPTGLTLKRDNVHFNRMSLREFGRRYWRAWKRVAENAAAD